MNLSKNIFLLKHPHISKSFMFLSNLINTHIFGWPKIYIMVYVNKLSQS